MDKSDSNLRTTIDNRKICNEDVAFKSQKCHSAKSNNCNYISNTSLNVRVQDRKILTEEVVLKQENGAVIYGVVLFENGKYYIFSTVINTIVYLFFAPFLISANNLIAIFANISYNEIPYTLSIALKFLSLIRTALQIIHL